MDVYLGEKGLVIWFTGLSSSGKTTLATELFKRLQLKCHHVFVVDGDQLRAGLSADLGFDPAGRSENIRRASELARLLADAGTIVIVTLISPFEDDRRKARRRIGDLFFEVFVDCPLEVCEDRDVKGLYGKARRGEIKNMTGIDSHYERPSHPDLTLRTDLKSISECVELLLSSPKLGKL